MVWEWVIDHGSCGSRVTKCDPLSAVIYTRTWALANFIAIFSKSVASQTIHSSSQWLV